MKRILFTMLLALSWVFPQNTEIMTEIGPALGYNASVKQLLHVSNENGVTTTVTSVYDADGTASALGIGTINATITTGAVATSDFIVTNGTAMLTLQGDVVDMLWRGDGTAASDFILEEDDGTDAFTFESDVVAFTFLGDGTADSDIAFGDGSTEFMLIETDNGDITIANGAYDFNIASHDGTNGLMLEGTLVTSSAAEINGLSGLTASSTELNYLDITTLGTGANTKAVVLDAGGDYTWEAAGIFTYAVLNDGTTTLSSTALELNVLDGIAATLTYNELDILDGVTATYTELNYLDITTLGTGANSKAIVLDAGDDYIWPTAGFLTYGGTQITATGAEINYLDITALGTGAASKAVVLSAGDDYTWPATGILTYSVLNDGTTALGATALELNTLDGVAATLTYGELNILDGVTATYGELNYLDITTLGTGAASKAVVLSAGDDYTWPGTGILTYGVLNDGTTTLNATAAEINASSDVLTEVVTTTNIIAANESGTRFILNTATAFNSELPAVAAGLHYWFYIGATEPTTSHTITTATSANIIQGQVSTGEDAAGSITTAPDSDTISFVANLAIHGDYVYVWCDGTYWYISGLCAVQDGMTTAQVS